MRKHIAGVVWHQKSRWHQGLLTREPGVAWLWAFLNIWTNARYTAAMQRQNTRNRETQLKLPARSSLYRPHNNRPIDFETTDAGPGVAISEAMVRITLLNDWVCKSRAHHLPRDSKSHLVGASDEQPKWSIWWWTIHVTTSWRSGAINGWGGGEKNEENARFWAEEVAKRYERARCMSTTVHARVQDAHDQLRTSSTRNICSSAKRQHQRWRKTSCREVCILHPYISPGSWYNTCTGGRKMSPMQGIRTVGWFRCPHSASRVPAPVPNVHDADSMGNLALLPFGSAANGICWCEPAWGQWLLSCCEVEFPYSVSGRTRCGHLQNHQGHPLCIRHQSNLGENRSRTLWRHLLGKIWRRSLHAPMAEGRYVRLPKKKRQRN